MNKQNKLQDLETLIPLLNAKRSFPIFTPEMTCLELEELPFFQHYDLISAQTFSSIPPVTFQYLWNPSNNDMIALDGTRDVVFDNLPQLGILLKENTIVPYLKFVLGCVWSEQGCLRLVQKTEDIEFSSNPKLEDLTFLNDNIIPAQVAKVDGKYQIKCSIVYGTELFEALIELDEKGIFDFISEKILYSEMNCLRTIMLE
jgi:hypothetical protein